MSYKDIDEMEPDDQLRIYQDNINDAREEFIIDEEIGELDQCQ